MVKVGLYVSIVSFLHTNEKIVSSEGYKRFVMRKIIIFIFSVFFLVATACSVTKKKSLILISKDYNGHIQKWMQELDPGNELCVFYNIAKDSMDLYLQQADAMIIGGGRDVHPSLYDKSAFVELCGSFDTFRDSIELLMINYAMAHDVPVLGICRGQQMLNVANGGSLIPDIPTFFPGSTLEHRSKAPRAHTIQITPDSWLARLSIARECYVNSRHHQCVDMLAPGFSVAARSADGVIESIEYTGRGHVFAKGVQWHPESLRDSLSMAVGRAFLKEID